MTDEELLKLAVGVAHVAREHHTEEVIDILRSALQAEYERGKRDECKTQVEGWEQKNQTQARELLELLEICGTREMKLAALAKSFGATDAAERERGREAKRALFEQQCYTAELQRERDKQREREMREKNRELQEFCDGLMASGNQQLAETRAAVENVAQRAVDICLKRMDQCEENGRGISNPEYWSARYHEAETICALVEELKAECERGML